MKMFYVVQLESDIFKEKIVVPSIWLDKYNTLCLLPPITDVAKVETLAKAQSTPKHGWQMHSLAFIQSFDTYSQAKEYITKGNPVMIELEKEEEEQHHKEIRGKRKRKRPRFLEQYFIDSDPNKEEGYGTKQDDCSTEGNMVSGPLIVKVETIEDSNVPESHQQPRLNTTHNKSSSSVHSSLQHDSQLQVAGSSSTTIRLSLGITPPPSSESGIDEKCSNCNHLEKKIKTMELEIVSLKRILMDNYETANNILASINKMEKQDILQGIKDSQRLKTTKELANFAEKLKDNEVFSKMKRNTDPRGVKRGSCLSENCDCTLYEYEGNSGPKCSYCFCPPTKHQKMEESVDITSDCTNAEVIAACSDNGDLQQQDPSIVQDLIPMSSNTIPSQFSSSQMDKVKQIILDCLPSSARNEIEKIMERLVDKGVDCYEDLQYIKFDEDFSDILKDVLARKLKAKVEILFSGNSHLSETSAAESSQACEPCQLSDKTNLNKWLEYKVPVKKIAQATTEKLFNNQRLSPPEYREVIRVVASDVMSIGKKPIKKQLEIVAKKFVQQFPVMQDCIDGIIIGNGHEGFLRKLIGRIENVQRPSANSIKRKLSKRLVSDNFSCPNFLPDITIDEKSLSDKRELLKKEYCSKNWKLNSVSKLMEETFPLQRLSICQKMPMSQIKDDWPYLFYSKIMIGHFNTLMKKDVVSEYEGIFSHKIPELYAFLEIQDLKTKIVFEKDQTNFLAALCAYFEEDVTLILNIFDRDESLLDLKEKSLPATPFIAAFGNPYAMKDNCVLMIENTGASEFINIKDASLLWFISFYVFNLEYPIGCPATAEFIQRVFFGINPEKGTKSPKRSTRSRINVKVNGLVEKLCSFKSMSNI